MTVKLKNNVTSTLAAAISASATSLEVASGHGALFPSLTTGEYFYVTLASSGGTIEVVKVTARVGDVFAIVRAQDDSTAASFAAGSRVELRVTARAVLDAASDAATALLPLAASNVSIADAGGYYVSTTAEAALQEAAQAATTTILDTSEYYTSTKVEGALQEVGASLTGKLARDGTSVMTGQLKAIDGTAAIPAYTFAEDTNTGFFRPSTDTIGVVVGGATVATFSSTGSDIVATGIVVPYISTSTAAPSGWVRAIGTTIGNASSGGTERANADTYNLFALLYASYDNTECPVSGGRGVSALADFNANKTLTVPNMSGNTITGPSDSYAIQYIIKL